MSSPYLDLLEALRTNCNLPEFPDPLPSTQLDLELENGPTVTIDFNEETEFVELFAEIGTYSSEQELFILKKIAQDNFLWSGTAGSTLSIRPEIQTVYLASQLPVLSQNGTDFVGFVEKFVDIVKRWQGILSKPQAESPTTLENNTESSSEEVYSRPPSPMDTFMMA